MLVWVTGPLSPGLRTRTDTFVFAGPGCGAPDPRSWFVEAALEPASGAATGGESPLETGLSHVQFQTQFQIQSRDSLLPVSVEIEVALPSQSVSVHVQFHGSLSPPTTDWLGLFSED